MSNSKFILFFILSFIGIKEVNSQSLSLFGINSSKYPIVSANFFLLNEKGERVSVNDKRSLHLVENGVDTDILSLSCPSNTEAKRISSVLTIDVSGSMQGRNMELAKLAAQTWINTLNLDRSQCAITSFDDFSYVNQDLTNDYNKLKRAVDNLKSALGGTNYLEAILNEKSGALSIVSAGLHKKVIVFLTDGASNVNTSEIITKAAKIGAVIHTIVLAMEAPQVLKNISANTGGMSFENVTGLADIERIYRIILLDALEIESCSITWNSLSCDNLRNVELQYIPYTVSDVNTYSIPDSSMNSLIYLPKNFIKFGFVKPDDTKMEAIEIKAVNPINISEIESSNPDRFQVRNYGGSPPPFFLKAGESRTLSIEYSPTDSLKSYSRFEIKSDACLKNYFFTEGGFAGMPAKDTTLRVIYPNGGEFLISGSKSSIIWDGVLPSDTVFLEYSSNNGDDWQSITNTASEFLYNWQVPNITSQKCLVKARHFSPPEEDETSHFAWYLNQSEANSVRTIALSPDGTMIAAAGDKGMILIWDAFTKEILIQKNTSLSYIYAMSWSENGKLLAVAGSGNSVLVLNIQNNSLSEYSPGHSGDILALDWSPKGNYLASGGSDSKVIVWDYQIMTLYSIFANHKKSVTSLSWNKVDANMIASGSLDGTVRVWTVANASEVRSYNSHNSPVLSVDWGRNNRIVSSDENQEFHIWDPTNGSLIRKFPGLEETIFSVKWNGNSDKIASGGSGLFVKLWDANTGKKIELFGGHLDVISSVLFSNDDKYIFSGSFDQSIKKWKIGSNQPITPFAQSDISDNVFTIIQPQVSVRDVLFNSIFINTKRDSLISAIIKNISPVRLQIDSIRISQEQDDPFVLSYNLSPFFLDPNEEKPLEIIFSPKSEKKYNGKLEVFSCGYIFSGELQGEGVIPSINMLTNDYDFGKVPVNAGNSKLIAVLTNIGSSPVEFLSINKIGPDTSQFLILQVNGEENKKFPFLLPQGAKIELLLIFTPKQTGKTSGNISFNFRGIGSPKIMRLFGEGIDAELLAPRKIDFPPIICEKKAIDTVIELTNTGANLLTVTSTSFTNNGDSEFSFPNESIPFNIDPYTTKYLNIRYLAAAFAVKSTTLTLLSNASNAANGLTNIILNTEYHNVDFSVNPEHVRMADLEPNTSTFTTFEIVNNGTFPLGWVVPQIKGKFTISAVEPNPTPPNSTSTATLSFEGGETGQVYDETYSLYDTCGGRKYVFFRAVIKTNQAQILTPNSIEFPYQICKDNPIDTLIEILNLGKTDLLISHIEIVDDNRNAFSLIEPFDNITVKPDSAKSVKIRVKTDDFGEFLAKLKIKSNAINSTDSLIFVPISFFRHKVDFSINTDKIFIGTSFENTPEKASFLIENTGTYPLQLNIPPASSPFEISSIIPPVTLPGEKSIAEILFSGGLYGEDYSHTFSFHDTCGVTEDLQISASVREVPSITIQVGIESAKPGELVEVPIILLDSARLANSLIEGYTAELKTLASILVPIGDNKGRIEDGWRFLTVELAAYPVNSNIFKKIQFRAVLGNAPSTPVELVNFKAKGGNLIRTIIPGMFSLEGLCQIGGTRLYYANNIVLGNAMPNPATTMLKIDFRINFSSDIKLLVFDAFGREKLTVIDSYYAAGDHAIEFNIDMLPPGIYSYHLISPTDRTVKFFSIIR